MMDDQKPSLVGAPGQPFSAEQYRTYMDVIVNVLRVLNAVGPDVIRGLETFLRKAETLAPILDPSAYMRGGADNLANQRDVLTAMIAVRSALDRIEKREVLR